MKEEAGVTLQNPQFLGYAQDHQFHVQRQAETSRFIMFFHAKITEEVTVDSEEAEEFKWVMWEELKTNDNKEGALTAFFKKHPDRPE